MRSPASIRRVANEYADDALRRTEEAISAALDEVRQSRSRFHSAAGGFKGTEKRIETIKEEDFI
jgi:hypothetical protein